MSSGIGHLVDLSLKPLNWAMGKVTPSPPAIPPQPFMQPAEVDQRTQDAEAEARRRQNGAAGIESTLGAGQSGMLNPSTIQQKTLLGQ